MYECVICHGVNHAARLHCQYCGAMPSRYSITAAPICREHFLPIAAAVGVSRTEMHKAERVGTRTVNLDYYADGE